MDILRTVERHSDKEVIHPEELSPPVINKSSVGLDRVDNLLAVRIFPLPGHGFLVEIQPEQKGLTSMPAECDFRSGVGGDILPDIFPEQFVAHHSLLPAILYGLVEVVAIGAIEVASRSGRLHDGGEGGRSGFFVLQRYK